MEDGPVISVVIATHNASRVIDACLAALLAQRDAPPIEIIIVDSSIDDTPQRVAQCRSVRLVHVSEPWTLAELRGRGIAEATGEIIAILDPYAIVDPDWAREVDRAHRAHPNLVIGGSVDVFDPGRIPLAAWALYINEYGLFMPPVAEGSVTIVPGCNVSYKRAALFDGVRPRWPVFWKTFANWTIESSGSPLVVVPAIAAALWKPIPFGDFLRTRFDHGRCFAAMRAASWSWPRRLLQAALCGPLPFVMIWRWGHVFWAKRRRRSKLVLTLPHQLALFGVWAMGECCGYLAGSGTSCRRLFY